MKIVRWIVVFMLICGLVFVTSCAKKAAQANADKTKLKLGFIYVGPIGDAGWTYSHNEGRLAVEKLPFVEKTSFVESVPEGAEAARTISQLAEAGNNVIFTTSFGYMDPTFEVAKKYPNVIFMHCSGYKTAPNMGTYFGRMYQANFLAGLVAGKMTKSGKIGMVAAHPIPEVIRHINAFAMGIAKVNPKAKVHVVWTNSWFDPGKEMDAANALMDMGCDIVAQNTDSAAPQQAAEKRGKFSIGFDSDMSKFAPKAQLTAPIWHWDVIYKKICEDIYNKTWKPTSEWWAINTGIVDLAPFNAAVPQDVQKFVLAEKQKLADGAYDVFWGPIKDQKGVEKLKAGQKMTDEDMLKFNWFVQNVVGEIPVTQ